MNLLTELKCALDSVLLRHGPYMTREDREHYRDLVTRASSPPPSQIPPSTTTPVAKPVGEQECPICGEVGCDFA